ncbi:hypothetical protein OC846_006453 [Tilletia horrida]|uniref:Uncharacterized protein n=1 Tax=Tilletia horrida TaxID=155126 RepID=A0AAN6GJY2_9BASI|nr:hypothetical protein OC846_006453 [Tilletia horrida]KAK0559782.1 hypothetical protein OC861_006538 [Tilletia horrida]
MAMSDQPSRRPQERERPYILLSEVSASAHTAGGIRSAAANRVDFERVRAMEESLRELRSLAAQSPASMSFSNFHSLLMIPDFPRLPATVPAACDIPLASHTFPAGSAAATQAIGSQLDQAAKASEALPLQQALRVKEHLLPSSIPHNLTPWEELSVRRDSDQRPYRDLYNLTGKRKRKQNSHPSWADGGLVLPLSSSRALSGLEAAVRQGTCNIDFDRMVAGGAGPLLQRLSSSNTTSDVSVEAAKGRMKAKRRRQQAGYVIGAGRCRSGDETHEVDDRLRSTNLPNIPVVTRSTSALEKPRADAANREDSDVESVYDSEVDEWEVEVAHAISLRTQRNGGSQGRLREGKALAVPLSSNPTLLQVPLSEEERQAWNEEARRERQLRLSGLGSELSPGSMEQDDPESTLPVSSTLVGSGDTIKEGLFRSADVGASQDTAGTEALEATLAIASQQVLMELTSQQEG